MSSQGPQARPPQMPQPGPVNDTALILTWARPLHLGSPLLLWPQPQCPTPHGMCCLTLCPTQAPSWHRVPVSHGCLVFWLKHKCYFLAKVTCLLALPPCSTCTFCFFMNFTTICEFVSGAVTGLWSAGAHKDHDSWAHTPTCHAKQLGSIGSHSSSGGLWGAGT